MFVATKGLLYLLRTAVLTYSKCDTVLFMVIATEVLLYLRTVGAIRCVLRLKVVIVTEVLLVGAILWFGSAFCY